jgi:hypothetical protein
MTDKFNQDRADDGVADSLAVTAIITIVVITLYYWLSGMPS